MSCPWNEVNDSDSDDNEDNIAIGTPRPSPSCSKGFGEYGVVRRVKTKRWYHYTHKDMPPIIPRQQDDEESDSDDYEADGAPVRGRARSVDLEDCGITRPVRDLKNSNASNTKSLVSPVSVTALDNFAWVTPKKTHLMLRHAKADQLKFEVSQVA